MVGNSERVPELLSGMVSDCAAPMRISDQGRSRPASARMAMSSSAMPATV